MRGGLTSSKPLAPASSFDYEAKRWGAARLRARPWYMNGLKLRYLLDDLPAGRARVLDVGCGAGATAKAVKAARPELDVVGCDVSESALAIASAEPAGVEFRKAAAERLPFADGEFDSVWIFDVLEHVDSPEGVLAEVARVLRAGGKFHIVLPLESQPRTLYRLVGCGTRWMAKVRQAGHIQIFSASRFESMSLTRGLRVARTRWSYHVLLQVLDLVYFTWLDWRGPVRGSVEDIAASRRGVVGSLMRLATMTVASIAWGEARLLRRIPGGCGHFTCVREG